MNIKSKILAELKSSGIRPKKSLGQNFLINESIYRKIVAALELVPDDIVIEVGPGLGTLTELLVSNGSKIIAVEKDHRLAEYLKQKFKNTKNVKIVEEDILNFQFPISNFQSSNYKVVGNIPYYITSHLLRRIFDGWPTPELVILTIQKEVAQRICAKPPKMSLLSVSVQYYAEPKIVSYVSSKSFWPKPKVDSAIVRLLPHTRTNADLTPVVESDAFTMGRARTNTENFFKIVKLGFAGKRKQLAGNLARGLKISKEEVEEKLRAVGIDPTRRAETLTLDEWQKLADTIYE